MKNSAEDVNQTLYFTPMSALRERNRFQNIEVRILLNCVKKHL